MMFTLLLYLNLNVFPSYDINRFYISVNGVDTNSGTIEKPFASFEAAQHAVREFKKSFPNTPVEVIVRGGIYYLGQTIEFTPEDSGTPTAPVIWKAADGEKVILSGGKRIMGKWGAFQCCQRHGVAVQ